MTAKFRFYQFNDSNKSVANEIDAKKLFIEETKSVRQNKIEVLVNDYGIAVWENELGTPISIRTSNNYNLILRKPIEQEFLAGKRFLERYSYFKILVDNFNGKGDSIMISANFEMGKNIENQFQRIVNPIPKRST